MAVQTGRFTLYNAGTPLRLAYETAETNYADFSISSGGDLTIAPTGGDTNVTGNLDVSGSLTVGTDIAYSELDLTGSIVNADISATAEIAVSKLADGAARQVLQTDAAGTGVEWTDSLNLPGSLDVTGAATLDTSLTIAGSTTVDGIIDDDTMATASDTTLATSESIKAYVDTQLTAEDLDFAGDSGTGAVDLDSQSLTIAGTTNQVSTSASGQTLTISLPSVVDLPGTLDVTGATTLDSTLTVSGDVSIADKIIHTGDTNTAIRFPAADTVTVETAGSEALRVDNAGRLSVGHTSALSWGGVSAGALQVAKSGANNLIFANFNNGSSYTSLALARSNSDTVGTYSYPQSGNALGILSFAGADASLSTFGNGASIIGIAGSTWTASNYESYLRFNTAASGSTSATERMRIDSSGDVGIGTTTPDYYNFGSTGNYFTVKSASTNFAAFLLLGDGSAASAIHFGNETIRRARIDGVDGSHLVFNTNATNSGTSVTERMRITSGGFLRVSNSGSYSVASSKHSIESSIGGDTIINFNNTSANPYGLAIDFTAASPDNNSNYFLYCADSTSDRCFIRSDGDLYNHDGVYGTISDEKLKRDIVDASSQWDDIKAMRFRKYRMKADVQADENAPYLLGLVAQELEQTSPGLVDQQPDMETVQVPVLDEDGNETGEFTEERRETGEYTKTVKSSILLMKAAKALQEAMERIETLEAKVAQLENA